MTPFKLALAIVLLAGPVAAKAPAIACPANLRPATSAELVFAGADGPKTPVNEADWRAFVSREVTPRFPDSLAVSDVYGQGGQGPFARQPAKAVLLVLTGAERERDKVHAIRDAYRELYRGDRVMLFETPACVAF
ncbi:MAG TPA: DUF3574 domain-containing protein [Caulobacteraceae bacterium]